jgi:hypothetical protein
MAPYLSSQARFFGFVIGVFFLPLLQYIHAAPRVPIGASEEVLLLGAVTGLVGGFAGGDRFDTGGFFRDVFGGTTGAVGFFSTTKRFYNVSEIPKTSLHWPAAL